MVGSTGQIVAIVIVAVCSLCFMLIAVNLAARQPGAGRGRHERMEAGVRGGRHIAVGGRSVAPSRETSVIATEETPHVPGPRPSTPPASSPSPSTEPATTEAAVPRQRAGQEAPSAADQTGR